MFGLPGVPGGVANDNKSQAEDAPDATDDFWSAGSFPAAAPPPDSSTSAMSRMKPDQEEETTDEQILSSNLIIGFYDEKEEPSAPEIESLMCEVQKYITDFLGSHLQDPDTETLLTNIGWVFDKDCHTPLNVMFAANAKLGDGSHVSADTMFQTLKLGDDEILDLIENYVYEARPENGPFSDVNQLTFETSTISASLLPEGLIDLLICPDSKAPLPTAATKPNRKGK